MLLNTSVPYTGGFLCGPNKMVRFSPKGRAVPGFFMVFVSSRHATRNLYFATL